MLYSLLNTIATLALLAYNLLHYKQKKLLLGGVSRSAMEHFGSKERQNFLNRILAGPVMWTIAEIIIVSFFQYYVSGFFNVQLGKVLQTGSNYFGNLFSAPFLVLAVCLLMKIEPLAQMDLITPAFPLALFFSKIGCYTMACCGGIPWEHGYYNPISRTIEFPVQLLEAGVALLLFIVLLCCKSKLKKGTVFPAYMVAFSGTRFFTEFFRWEPNVILGLKVYHILCIVGVLVGLLEWYAVGKYRDREQGKMENNHL